jgi:hypothetical protein
MDRISQRKPKLHFDVAANPSHVTFDDGKEQRRNIPWLHYEEACWDYAEPDTIRMDIGDCVVVIRGQNLGPLFQAIEEETLMRIRAQPQLEQEGEREMDTFATEIRFLRAARNAGLKNGQSELNLRLG